MDDRKPKYDYQWVQALDRLFVDGTARSEPVVVAGVSFVLKALSADSEAYAAAVLPASGNAAYQMQLLAKQTVRLAVHSVDGKVVGDSPEERAALGELLGRLPAYVVNKLYRAWDELMVKVNRELSEFGTDEGRESFFPQATPESAPKSSPTGASPFRIPGSGS